MSAGNAHRLAILQKLEEHLTPQQLDSWRVIHGKLPSGHPHVGTDWGLELYLIKEIISGKKPEDLARYIPNTRHGDRRQADRRMLTAGDKDAA